MTYRKLNLDRDKVDQCRALASRIASPLVRYIDRHSTTSVERTVLRIMGVTGGHQGLPQVGRIIDSLPRDDLRKGVGWWFGKALVHTGLEAAILGQKISANELRFDSLPQVPEEKIRQAALTAAAKGLKKIADARAKRKRDREALG